MGISVTLHKRVSDHVWRVFAKPARKCRIDDVITFSNDFAAIVLGRGFGGDVELKFIDPASGNILTRMQLMPVLTNMAVCRYYLTLRGPMEKGTAITGHKPSLLNIEVR